MILNVWTVSALFLAAVGFVVAAAAAVVSARSLLDRDRVRDAERAQLLALIVVVLLLVRALAWPHFYLLLESYVPALAADGVMCTYGVTRVQPGLVATLQWAKPAALALLAFWWGVTRVDRATEPGGRFRPRFALLLPVAVVAMAECVVEVAYLFSRKTLGRPVTCCSQMSDVAAGRASTQASPLALLGLDTPGRVLALYGLVGIAVVALALVHSSGDARRTSPLLRAGVVLLAIANLVVAHWAWLDAVAPRVLGLPYHHCVYEVVTRAPAMGLAALFTIAGSMTLIGSTLFASLRSGWPAVDGFERRMRRVAALLLASALWIVMIHVT